MGILMATATPIPPLWPDHTTELMDAKALCKACSVCLPGKTALSHPQAWAMAHWAGRSTHGQGKHFTQQWAEHRPQDPRHRSHSIMLCGPSQVISPL